jgi:hypothetical protein
VAQLYPWALGSLYFVFYDSQGYGGGILTLPLLGWKGACIYSLQEWDGPGQSQVNVKVKSQSHVTSDGQSISMPWGLVHSALKGFHPKIFDIRRCTLRRNCWCYHWEGCIRSMQCNVEFGYQLSICSGTKENHGKS